MPDEATKPEPTKEKKRDVKTRDLTPKRGVKGGATQAEKNVVRRTGEIDFMKGVN
jgi:hypothetical protein